MLDKLRDVLFDLPESFNALCRKYELEGFMIPHTTILHVVEQTDGDKQSNILRGRWIHIKGEDYTGKKIRTAYFVAFVGEPSKGDCHILHRAADGRIRSTGRVILDSKRIAIELINLVHGKPLIIE